MFQLIFCITVLVMEALCTSPGCRCRPDDLCWPSRQHWQGLNISIDGNLVAVKPVAFVCHDPTFDKSACEAVNSVSNSSRWRSSQPGAVQWQNWEAIPTANQSCYLESPRALPCGQGRVSLYSALVESSKHVQKVIRFAKHHNIRVVVKNTGHDFLGRSSAPHSLQISTYKMKDMQFTDNFVIRSGSCKTASYGPAVTIGAGVLLKDLYTAVGAKGLAVVAGLSHTVGAAGGYVQGGGHSPLGTWKGMASDNALAFELITATGRFITVNEFQYPDLFWALRGGGGGTFGVVTSVTMRTYPDVPLLRADLAVEVGIQNAASFWNVVQEYHAYLPRLNDAGGSGYYFITPKKRRPSGTYVSLFESLLLFPNQTDESSLNRLFAPLLSSLNLSSTGGAYYAVQEYPHTRSLFEEFLSGESDPAGGFLALGSRMVSRDFLTTDEGPRRLSAALSRLRQEPDDEIRGHVVAGGQVARNTTDSAVSPAWRKTVTHISIGHIWQANATVEQQQAIRDNITNREVPILKSLEPGKMGAYLNEADANEADFQTSFWGSNYRRLYEVKQRWDAGGLFITRRGVGSEDWDDVGMCKTK